MCAIFFPPEPAEWTTTQCTDKVSYLESPHVPGLEEEVDHAAVWVAVVDKAAWDGHLGLSKARISQTMVTPRKMQTET